jgi:DNA-binding NtrC family response regulator
MDNEATVVLLVGSDAALLEGLTQSLAALGYQPSVAATMREARELSLRDAPLVVVVDSALASRAPSETLSLRLAAGGALIFYHCAEQRSAALSPALQRSVLTDLALPLERQRLIALVRHVSARAQAAGRVHRDVPPEQSAR